VHLNLEGPNSRFPLNYQSQRHPNVTNSTPEAEIYAGWKGLRTVLMPALDVWDKILPSGYQAKFHEDNQAMIRICRSGRNLTMRHLGRAHRISIASLYEQLGDPDRDNNINLFYEESHKMAADIYTKHFTDEIKWREAARLINVVPIDSWQKLESTIMHFNEQWNEIKRECGEAAAKGDDDLEPEHKTAGPAISSTTTEDQSRLPDATNVDGSATVGTADEQSLEATDGERVLPQKDELVSAMIDKVPMPAPEWQIITDDPSGCPKVFKHKTADANTQRGAEIFSGSAGISRETCGITRYTVEAYDIIDGPGGDITDIKVFERLLSRIRAGVFAFLWFGVPCNTYSLARRNDGKGPGPLRSDDGPGLYGLPELKAQDQLAVDNANLMTSLATKLIKVAIGQGVAVIVENPFTSRLWKLPIFKQLASHGSSKVFYDQCAYGCPWRKSTTLLTWNCAGLQSAVHRCTGSIRRCSFTGVRHTVLKGKDKKTRVWMTKVADAYPTKFCRDVALFLRDNILEPANMDQPM
jgi:hypothetical protein